MEWNEFSLHRIQYREDELAPGVLEWYSWTDAARNKKAVDTLC
jgi:hypothetical protein